MADIQFKVDIDGLDELTRALVLGGREAVTVMGRELYAHGTEVLERSVSITPIDTGALRSSAGMEGPEVSGRTVTVRLGFGGAAIPYAVEQHENLEYYHEPPTQAKYLEQPTVESADKLYSRLKAGIEELLS